MGTNSTPPPTPAGTATMPSTKHSTNNDNGHAHHGHALAPAVAAHTGDEHTVRQVTTPAITSAPAHSIVLRLVISMPRLVRHYRFGANPHCSGKTLTMNARPLRAVAPATHFTYALRAWPTVSRKFTRAPAMAGPPVLRTARV